ncbi:MAG: SUMF1/EgtB/PvdO family nonheme iron enzyme [Pseudomonadota bacterium]|nr:SUMF1/EgtB/PvdO family nonheme iron enzyme [Pseudomonadota bacterium]
MTRTGAVQIYAHAANAAFAERLAAALDVAGYEIVTGPFNRFAVDAVIVVWSGAAMGSVRLLEAAREPRDCGMLAPVSIGMVEPPEEFRHLPPVNLGGWSGDTADPRWRRVLEAIEEAAYAMHGPAPASVATPPSETPADPPLAAPRIDAAETFARARRTAGRAAIVAGNATAGAFQRARKFSRAAARLSAVAAGWLFREMRRILQAALRVPRAPVAASVALAGALTLAAFLLITPNSEPAPMQVAEAPAAAIEEPPILAAANPTEAPPPDVSPAAASEAAQDASTAPSNSEETAAADEPLVVAEAEAAVVPSEDGPVIAEGDTDYPDAEPLGPPPAASSPQMGPRLAPARLAALDDGDQIADLIASSVPAQTDDQEADELAVPASGGVFRDCSSCPEMAPVPPGRFVMGSPASEPARQATEGPQTEVTIARPFAIGAKEVTFAEWDACVAAGACRDYAPDDAGWGRGSRPVINVSWDDAQSYAAWLSEKTGFSYRLPSEEEWEYAARAGAKTPFFFGPVISTRQANFDGSHPYGGEPGEIRRRTMPAGSFAANPLGLYDMHGNVWEWVADCWSDSHANAPSDGEPRGGACSKRVLKGGAWNTGGWRLRAGHRIGKADSSREFDNGFRVARDMD